MDPKSLPNGAIGGPGAAKGRLCPPPWSILRVPKIGRFLNAPWVAKKSMDVRLGRLGGAKWRHDGSARARRELGGGVRFEKRVPRAASRARLINKLIKFKQFIIFKIFNNLQNIQKDQKIRIFGMISQRRWPVAWRILST